MVCGRPIGIGRENLHMADTQFKHYLLASDFDQTLSFNDSGLVLSELLGVSGFDDRVRISETISLAAPAPVAAA
jgi:hypothetical protein